MEHQHVVEEPIHLVTLFEISVIFVGEGGTFQVLDRDIQLHCREVRSEIAREKSFEEDREEDHERDHERDREEDHEEDHERDREERTAQEE